MRQLRLLVLDNLLKLKSQALGDRIDTELKKFGLCFTMIVGKLLVTPCLPISFTIPIAPRLPNHWTVHPSTWQHQQTCLGTQILGADELVDGAQLDGD